ncbi:Beta-alanine-activating enzyme [Pseudolycoriella hygida]|uniref:Beta-alanine-activating enzyme n=1 Tax=Pseudolycoriella hygida TaxID=35572 RepID=A0A9Q0S7W8_9DIPT|nr:Beta-alanine-activating enzyme [Pseudolycoriella hygida]
MFKSEQLFGKFSNRRAVIWEASTGKVQFTYDDILRATKIVAKALQRYITQNNQKNVGVLLHHSAEIAPVILGILDVCCTFCCLNSNQSPAEIKETILLLRCNIGVADKSFLLKHPNYETLNEIVVFNSTLLILRLSTEDFVDGNDFTNGPDREENRIFQSSTPMFCCSTSGTTGKAKTVQVPFRCLMPNVESLSKHYAITQTDVIYISSPPTFDPFVVDLFLGLFNGATILMVSNDVRLSTKLLVSSFEINSVTIAQITPSLFRRFPLHDIRNRLFRTLRCLILGGEPFPSMPEVKSWFGPKGEGETLTRLFNIYGITEISSTIYEVTLMDIQNESLIPIGSPLDPHTTLKVVDCVNKEIIDNGIGELFIQSKIRKCVLRESGQSDTMVDSIATGDLVDVKSGTIYYKTRVNNIVKIFGRKVNLTKIENTAKSNWLMKDACCVFDNDKYSLNLFIQRGDDWLYTKKEILQGLKLKLLEQEVPNNIHFVDEFPLSCHGKISKSKLLEMIQQPVTSLLRDYFLSKLEENFLGFDADATLKLSFLAAGGTSVLALQLINELEIKFNFSDDELMTMLLNSELSVQKILFHLQKFSPNESKPTIQKAALPLTSTWSHNLEKCIDASPTICRIDNKYIVSVGSHSHILVNVDLISGQLLSKLILPHRIECQVVQYANKYGIVGCYDGFVYSFDIQDGSEKWKFNSHGMVKSRMCLVDDFIVFGNYNSVSNVWCLRADDGAFIWNKKIGNKSVYAGIVAIENKLFVSTLDGVCAIVELYTGNVLCETKLQSPIFSTPKAVGNNVFVAEVLGIIHCVDRCGNILCSFRANGNIYSSIESVGDNSISFGCYDKSVYCISYDTNSSLFKLLWKLDTSGQIFSSPKTFVFDGMNLLVVCCTNGTISLLNWNGEVLKQFRVDGEVFATPAVTANKVIIGDMTSGKATQEYLIYVTGFGPFAGHEAVNASWEAVQLLPTQRTVRNQSFHLKLVEIPVIYDKVDKFVERIWEDNPKLVIHCGVDGSAKKIRVEKHAYNSNYCKADWSGKCLDSQKICLKNNGIDCDSLSTCIDVEKIVNELNSILPGEIFASSTKVGNYLCGYIYLNSLDINCDRTLFIHVPPVNLPYTSQQTSDAILAILDKCVEQLFDEGKI